MRNIANSLVCFVLAMLFGMGVAQLEVAFGKFSAPAWCLALLALASMAASVWYMHKAGQAND